jgi:hypothetical protein
MWTIFVRDIFLRRFVMKNKFIFGLLLIVVGGLFMTIGCEDPNNSNESNNDNSDKPNMVRVENITASMSGGQVDVFLFAEIPIPFTTMPTMTAVGNNIIDSENRLTVALTVPENNTQLTSTWWKGQGNYYVFWAPRIDFETTLRIYTQESVPVKVSIDSVTTTLDFAGFKLTSEL